MVAKRVENTLKCIFSENGMELTEDLDDLYGSWIYNQGLHIL